MGDLKEVLLDFFQLLDIALLLRVSLADLLDLASLNLQHLVLHLQLLLIVWRVHRLPSPPLTIHIAVLGHCHSLLALDHLVILVEGNELPIVPVAPVRTRPAEGTRSSG